MDKATVTDIQKALAARGFNPGPIDGLMGRRTAAAITAFQRARRMKVSGVADAETVAALLGSDAAPSNLVARPWLDLALRKKGLNENRDTAELAKFLRSDGGSVGDPRKLPWCGDFVETCIALTLPNEPLPGNPYLARNWMKFGVPCKPQLGAILVFWRGSRSGISGHVAFDVGAGKDTLYILGGNQQNTVSVAPKGVGYLLGARWPSTVPLPTNPVQPQMSGGALSINEA